MSRDPFALKRPCVDCPFRTGYGERFQLHPDRLDEIFAAPSFACHKTVEHDDDGEPTLGHGERYCAGLMAVLHRENRPNQMMRIGERLGLLDCTALDPDGVAYESIAAVRAAHARRCRYVRQA